MRRGFAIALLALMARWAYANCTTPHFEETTAAATFNRQVIADFDKDGKPDIAALAGDLLLYKGNGTLTPDAPVTLYAGSFNDIVASDVNGDTWLDIVFGGSNVGILLNDQNGGFTGPSLFSAGNTVRRIATGDFNKDSRLDIFVVFTSGGSLFVQDSNGQFANASNLPTLSVPRDIVAGDFNLDTNLDLFATGSSGLVFVPGNGDGTFGSTAGIGSPTPVTPIEIEAADLDVDGDLDIVSADDANVSVTVWRNDRENGFTAVNYPIQPPSVPGGTPRPSGLALADFNGDGDLDIAAAGTRSGYIAVLTGNGDATFDAPSYTFVATEFESFQGTGTLRTIRAADFDLDGRIDIAAEQQRIGVMSILQNVCGLATIDAVAPPMISAGQTLQVSVVISGATTPTGTVTLKNGATVLDTETLAGGAATLEASLPAGTYSLVVQYAGDAELDPADSAPIPVTVTTHTTSVAITKSVSTSVWGQAVTFTATVTSTDNSNPITGTVELFIDGDAVGSGAAPIFDFTTSTLTAGAHTLTARYLGSANHPPSNTAMSSHTVTKATSDLQLRSDPSPYNGTAIVEAIINQPYTAGATGTIRLYEGTTLLGTIDASIQPRIFTLSNLSLGTHYFRATYTGDANVLGDDAPLHAHTVVFNEWGLAADGGPSSISVIWIAPPNGATELRLMRSVNRLPFGLLATLPPNTRSYVDSFELSPNVIYRYQVEFRNGSGGLISVTTIDAAQLVTLTNEGPLLGIPIRAAQFNEILAATNVMRNAAMLSPISITFSGPVQASHLNQLRTAINEARDGIGAIPFTWAETITLGVPIRAVHVQQLRDAVR